MGDSNLIANLYPPNEEAHLYSLRAILMKENSERYIAPQLPIASYDGSRESTASLDDTTLAPNHVKYPGLQLTFNRGPKTGKGFVFGTDASSCDIVLPKHADSLLPGRSKISRRHLCITFDEEGRLVLRDFSTQGTIVTYDGQGKEKRRGFQWILGGGGAPTFEKIIIEIEEIKFRIFVSDHDTNPQLYKTKLTDFSFKRTQILSFPLAP